MPGSLLIYLVKNDIIHEPKTGNVCFVGGNLSSTIFMRLGTFLLCGIELNSVGGSETQTAFAGCMHHGVEQKCLRRFFLIKLLL